MDASELIQRRHHAMTQAQIKSRTAGLADATEPDDDDEDSESRYLISGTAIGPGDVTNGLNGLKYWGPEKLKAAASSLIGNSIKALHSEQEAGEVVDAKYIPGRGVVYEAELEDAKLAKGVESGRLTVSIEATHYDGGEVETDRGTAMAATGVEFTGMAIVQKGAAPSATAEPGEAAALSPAEAHAVLNEEGDPEADSADGGEADAGATEAALASLEDVEIGDVIAWRTGNGSLAYGKVRGTIESGSYDSILDVDRRVTAPAILAVRYRPAQGNEWESTEKQLARNPGSVTVLENFPAAPAREPSAEQAESDAGSNENPVDPSATLADYEEGATVQWDWSGDTVYGRIAETFVDEGAITRTLDGTEVSRDSDEEPVYLLDVWRGLPDDADGEGEYSGQALKYSSNVDSWDAPEAARMAELALVNGETVDLTLPDRVQNAIEAGLKAKQEYANEIGDCGNGVGEAMAEALLEGPTPELILDGGDVADNGGPVTYLSSHAEDAPDTPPTEWGEDVWTDGCGPVQDALWGHYLEWFEDKQAELEAAMDEETAAAASIPYEVSNISTAEVAAEDGAGFTDDAWDGAEVIASLPNPSEDEDAAEVLDQTMAVVPADDDARDAKSNWKAPFRNGVEAAVNTRALVAIDAALSGARGGFDDLDEETESELADWTESMLEAAPDDLYGAGEENVDADAAVASAAMSATPEADDVNGAEDSGQRGTGPTTDGSAGEVDGSTSPEADMTDDDNEPNEDVTELKARLSEKTDRIDDLEAELSELRDENETLEARAEAVDEAEEAFASALAEHVPRDAEALQADLSLNQMREWLEDIDEASVEDAAAADPDVRSGAGTETANLSEDERKRKQELESKLSELEDKDGILVEKEQDRIEAELADLSGGEA